MTYSALVRHRWSRAEYERMVQSGVFSPEDRLELIDGEIWEMTPQSSLHATAVRRAEEALRKVLTAGFDVRVQLPLALDPDSEPEPDLAVVPGSIEDYRDAHPRQAALVIEVSDSSLDYDRNAKLHLYAAHAIGEYWIVNPVDSQIEVHRSPAGGTYEKKEVVQPGGSLSPLARAEAEISVEYLLP